MGMKFYSTITNIIILFIMGAIEIRKYADDIYALLLQRGKLSIRKIGELTSNRESSIYLSLGWLLKEHKIKVTEMLGDCFVELENYKETYFG